MTLKAGPASHTGGGASLLAGAPAGTGRCLTEGENFDGRTASVYDRPPTDFDMSVTATTFVRRHLLVRVNRTKGLILMVLADVADDAGRARMTQPMIATDIGSALSTVERHIRPLLRDQLLTKGGGRTYVITGVAQHDIAQCDHVECVAEAGVGGASARKRALAAARARKAREKRKREAASSGR